MSVVYDVVCPYCGFKNIRRKRVESVGRVEQVVVVCDLDDGGCDRSFVERRVVNVEAVGLKIEGGAR